MVKMDNPSIMIFMVITCWFVNILGGMAQTRNNENSINAVKVGVVLDVSDGTFGKIGLSCINMALSDFYDSHSHHKTRIQIVVRDSHKDVVTAAAHGT
jgi:ionotropic glutamate receptor